MIVDRSDPVNLFALVPQLGTGFDGALRELDTLLEVFGDFTAKTSTSCCCDLTGI